MFPATACQVRDTWVTGGLRGTGSHDFSVHDLFVPAERPLVAFAGEGSKPGILYRFPFSLFAVLIAAVPLGITRGALSALIDHSSPTRDTGFSGSGGAALALSSSESPVVIVFDCKGIPTTSRERIETTVEAPGGHVKEPWEGWSQAVGFESEPPSVRL
jgi:hypothetical protein